jgi:hypothetical protein
VTTRSNKHVGENPGLPGVRPKAGLGTDKTAADYLRQLEREPRCGRLELVTIPEERTGIFYEPARVGWRWRFGRRKPIKEEMRQTCDDFRKFRKAWKPGAQNLDLRASIQQHRIGALKHFKDLRCLTYYSDHGAVAPVSSPALFGAGDSAATKQGVTLICNPR